MEHFTVEGQWWLPHHPDRRVAGTLTFNADGLELVLYDALRRFEMPDDKVVRVGSPEWEVEPVIHGTTRDRRRFTLLNVGGANVKGPLEGEQEVYRPELALDGCHTASDRFAEAWCDFDYLDAWADPPPVTIDGDDQDAVRVRMSSIDLTQTRLGGVLLRLVSGVEGRAGSVRVELGRWTSFAVIPPEAKSAREFVNSYVRPLQEFLMFCIGGPVRLTSLQLAPTDSPDPREGRASASFSAVQPASPKTPTVADIESYNAPTILSLRQSPIEHDQLLARWFDLWGRYEEVLTLLHAPLHAPFMYSEHGFASTFQSAEALHDLVLPTRDVSKTDHAKRVEKVTSAIKAANVDAATFEWAVNVLRSRNDKPLWRKIEDLVKSTGFVGEAVLEADPGFASTTAGARTGVSHGGASKTLDTAARYWYGQVLRWVVRTRLLMALLDDADDAQRRVLGRSRFSGVSRRSQQRDRSRAPSPIQEAGQLSRIHARPLAAMRGETQARDPSRLQVQESA